MNKNFHHKINKNIISSTGMVKILDQNGEFLGEMYLSEALSLAYRQEKDLVQISYEDIPVCRICNYNLFKYELKKKNKEKIQAQKIKKIKIIKLSLNIGENDLKQKIYQTVNFVTSGHDVEILIRLKGRENSRPDIGIEFLKKIVFPDICMIKKHPVYLNKDISMIITKKKI